MLSDLLKTLMKDSSNEKKSGAQASSAAEVTVLAGMK